MRNEERSASAIRDDDDDNDDACDGDDADARGREYDDSRVREGCDNRRASTTGDDDADNDDADGDDDADARDGEDDDHDQIESNKEEKDRDDDGDGRPISDELNQDKSSRKRSHDQRCGHECSIGDEDADGVDNDDYNADGRPIDEVQSGQVRSREAWGKGPGRSRHLRCDGGVLVPAPVARRRQPMLLVQ